MAKKIIKKTKKTRRIVQKWQAHIKASFNNTIVTITDEKWNVLAWASWWSNWFKWSRESTPYAAQVIAEDVSSRVKSMHSMEIVDVFIKWIWIGREQAIRGLISWWLDLNAIFDTTPVPHNWCKRKKVRRM